jgi:TolB-like protein/DNA-binding winged helix-turn-helix (wHTH) protein/tetratricopeptide (TPR) repeat protein
MNAPEPFEIGDWRLDPATGTLRGPAGQRHLTPKLTDLLVVLAQRAGQVVTRDELLSRVWGERGAVSDEPLTRAVAELRKILGDVRADPCYIETIPKRGYRVVAPVSPVAKGGARPEAPPRDVPPSSASAPSVPVPAPAPIISDVAALPQTTAPAAAAARPRMPATGRWLPLALGIAAALVVVIVVALALRPPSAAGPGRAVGVAVLPFADLSPAADRQYFADGVHEAIITRLSTIAGLRVTSYSAVSGYRDARKPVRDVARELGVDAVMQGSVRYANDRVRVTAQLIDAERDANVWGDTLDRPLTLENLFDIQAEVADQVAKGLTRTLAVGGAARDELPTASLPAYEAFLLGKYHYRRRQLGDVRIAIEQFQIAVNADGGFADAWDWLAYAWVEAGGALDGSTPARAFPRARAAALRALELDRSLATSSALLGFLRATYDWDWQGGLGELERAAAAAPSETGTIWSYAYVLALLGRHEQAIGLVRTLAETFPEDGRLKLELAERLVDAGRFPEAVEQANAALAGGAEPGLVRELLGGAKFGSGDLESAIAELENAVRLQRRGASVVSRLAAAYGYAGRSSDARALLGELEARAVDNELNVAPVARVYLALGDRERALTLLERGVEQRQRDCLTIGSDPFFAALRGDARFADLTERMGLSSPTP